MTTLTTSIRDARAAQEAINDDLELAENLHQTYSNAWEFEEADEESLEMLIENLKAQLESAGVTEYDIINE